MTSNMGSIDRVARALVGLSLAVPLSTSTLTGPLAAGLALGTIVLVSIATIDWCPWYLPFRFSTRGSAPGTTP